MILSTVLYNIRINDHSRYAIERGIHVLVTKPPVMTVKDQLELVALAKAKNVFVRTDTPHHPIPRHATPRHATPRHAMARRTTLHYAFETFGSGFRVRFYVRV